MPKKYPPETFKLGDEVVRKVDYGAGVIDPGVIVDLWENGARVKWEGSGFRTVNQFSRLLLLTPERKADLEERERVFLEERKKAHWEEAIFLCTNVNPQARVSNDGHKKPMELPVNAVRDGKCWYCGAVVVKRCGKAECLNPALEDTFWCEKHKNTEV